MRIRIDFPIYILGYNQSVLCNTSKPHSSLENKSSSIALHFVREGTAKYEWRNSYINTHSNPADMLTKSLSGGEKRSNLFSISYTISIDVFDGSGLRLTFEPL